MCITDFSGSSQYMDLVDGLIAGSDIWDSPMPKIHTTKAANYENDAYIVTQMRNAMHHILYTVVNSNAMNGWASTDTLKTVTPWWQTAIYALIAVLAVLTILCAWQLSKALKAKKSTGRIPLPQRTRSNSSADFRNSFKTRNGSLSPKIGGQAAVFCRKKETPQMGEQTAKAPGLNRAKTYQLVLFPLNNGATNVYYVLVLSYIATFGSKVLALSMIFASVMVTGMRLFDAITDPIIGALMDRTNGKFGKFRPFMVIGNLIMAASILVLYCLTPLIPASSMGLRYAAFVALYAVWVIGYTFQTSCTRSGQTVSDQRPQAAPSVYHLQHRGQPAGHGCDAVLCPHPRQEL